MHPSIGPASQHAEQLGLDAYRVVAPKVKHTLILPPEVKYLLVFGRGTRKHTRRTARNWHIVTRYWEQGAEAREIAEELCAHGYTITKGAVEQYLHRAQLRAVELCRERGIEIEQEEEADDKPRFDRSQFDPTFQKLPQGFNARENGVAKRVGPQKGWRPVVPDIINALDGKGEARVRIEGFNVLAQKSLVKLGASLRPRKGIGPYVEMATIRATSGESILRFDCEGLTDITRKRIAKQHREMYPEQYPEQCKEKTVPKRTENRREHFSSKRRARELLRKLIAHERSARAIGSLHEADAFAAKAAQIQELVVAQKNFGEHAHGFVET